MYQPIANKASVVGFMAGKPVGVFTHYAGATKPCKRLVTGSQLVCPFCEAKHTPVWRGYVPFYDQEYTRRFVLIPEDYYESVCEIPHLAQIRLSRGKGSREPIVIAPHNWRITPIPAIPERAAEVDLIPFLPRIWKDDELIAWVEKQRAAAPPKPSTRAKPARTPAADETGLMVDGIKNRLAFREDGELKPLAELMPNLVGRNGNSKHPKS